jgi:hypothetical protein
VFKLSNSPSGWRETVIHTFQHTSTGAAGYGGGLPASNVTFDTAGNLYGTTPSGGRGNGVVFRLSPNSSGGWTENVVYSLFRGASGLTPYAGVTLGSSGHLFGTTIAGGSGACTTCGVVFEITP